MTDKSAIVTGAAAGLGRATALLLAGAGANVCVVDIDAAGLASTAAEIRALGRDTLVKAVDLADGRQCPEIVSDTVRDFGRLDALCNVAAVFMPSHTTDMTDDQWDTTLAVNLSAPFKLIRAAIPHLLNRHGAVVNVSSCAAHMGQAYLAAYSATKAALNHMTRSLAMEYIRKPIRINAVAPGGMMTALAAGLATLPDPDPGLLGRFTPLRGVNDIEDVARLVVFLASDAARGYHGSIINIDNGITAG
jgi:NAD(P)-dependent dehydrogenase (short-subunit alcohol dehydrogenase family)